MIIIAQLFVVAAMSSKGSEPIRMQTCQAQSSCIAWSQTESPRSKCDMGDCEWTICARLDLGGDCAKSADDTVSHSCVLDPDTCNDSPNHFATATEVEELNNGYEQCQTGKPGQYMYFLFKDGRSCDLGGAGDFEGTIDGVALYCSPREGRITSCTGNAPGVECVWSLLVPECTITAPPTPPLPGGPINSCPYQEDCLVWSLTKIDDDTSSSGPRNTGDCSGGEVPCCEVEVCVELDLDLANCRKSGTISHVCEKDDNVCNPHSGFYDAMEVDDVEDGHRQCQRGVPGQTLEFLFKDGKGCDVKQHDDDEVPISIETSISTALGSANLKCEPRACCIDTITGQCGTGGRFLNSPANKAECVGGTSSCTGNAGGKECVWTFTIPQNCGV